MLTPKKGKSRLGVLNKIINSFPFTKSTQKNGPVLPPSWEIVTKINACIDIVVCPNLGSIERYGLPSKMKP
jgi:hypothetical protein